MKKKLTDILYSFSLLLFVIAFNFQHNPPSGWYQQFLPADIGGRQISDIFFLDSLTGWAVTPFSTQNDTVYVIKTNNGGDNWFVNYTGTGQFVGMKRIYFINEQTGYACGNGFDNSSQNNFAKTTNSGANWFNVNPPDPFLVYEDMSVLNEDTIWLSASSGFDGGVFRTTNGGTSWTQQANLGNQNPTNIYFYNKDTGYAAAGVLYKTTNSGNNWFQIPGGGFGDMHFINALTGWKCYGPMQKTIDGGMSWENVPLPPQGGFFNLSAITNFSFIGKDTIWGVGSRASTSLGFRGLILKSSNGGNSWGYQLPDTNSIIISRYFNIDFINQLTGWSYSNIGTGVHTVTGGDTTYYFTSINQVGSEIPSDYILHQNFPNPFNPTTKIKYELKSGGMVKLKVFDIRGREVSNPVKEDQQPGVYELNFSASEYGMVLSSGIYFYSLYIDEKIVDTKKMLMIK